MTIYQCCKQFAIARQLTEEQDVNRVLQQQWLICLPEALILLEVRGVGVVPATRIRKQSTADEQAWLSQHGLSDCCVSSRANQSLPGGRFHLQAS